MKLKNLGEKELKIPTRAQYPVFWPKSKSYSYFVANSEKASSTVYFKSRYSVKPKKLKIYFTHDYR